MVCGGDYYDRETYSVEPTPSSGGGSAPTQPALSYSQESEKILSQNQKLSKVLDPKQFVAEKLTTGCKNPIVFCLDVTGSMQNWPKIVYDKLPMFYGQIMVRKYLEDPFISFCAFGDSKDNVPLQVSAFGRGKGIDQMISKMVLEGGGGGQEYGMEMYEFAIWYYLNFMDHESIENSDLPFFFITGDESFYPKVNVEEVKKHVGVDLTGDNKEEEEEGEGDQAFVITEGMKEIDTMENIKKLQKLFKGNVFLLRKPMTGMECDGWIQKNWEMALGKERVLTFENPKAIMDVALGVISIVSGNTMSSYIEDMEDKGQDQARIEMVKKCLTPLSLDPRGAVVHDGPIELMKGEKLNLENLNKISLWCNWDISFYIDSGCACFKDNGEFDKHTCWNQMDGLYNNAIKLNRNNPNVNVKCDGEHIVIDLKKIPKNITSLFVTINVWDAGKTFKDVAYANIHLTDDKTGKIVCRYNLVEMGKCNCQIMCSLTRNWKNLQGWEFSALGEKAQGRNCNDPPILGEMQKYIPDGSKK